MKKLTLLFVFGLVGCCTTPEADAVARERGFLKVTKERFLNYSKNDATLTDAKKKDDKDYFDALDSWVTDREKALAE